MHKIIVNNNGITDPTFHDLSSFLLILHALISDDICYFVMIGFRDLNQDGLKKVINWLFKYLTGQCVCLKEAEQYFNQTLGELYGQL